MILHLVDRRTLAVALLTLLVFAPAGFGDSVSVHTKRGFILEFLEDGGFKLDNDLIVRRTESTFMLAENTPYMGDLQVGLEVEAKGELLADGGTIIADRIVILTSLTGEVEGTAVVEGRDEKHRGLVLVADGRKLTVADSVRLSPPEKDNRIGIKGKDFLQPGVFVHYRGRWTRNGVVDVIELTAWENELREKEKEIYQKYDPKMLLPRHEDSGPPVLRVGKNRYEVLDDSKLQVYLDRIGTRLLPEPWKDGDWTAHRGYRFWFLAAAHQRPQASAFPSGVVVVHSSLFRHAENEAQLAFAIAHEIAHVIQEHAWQEYQYNRGKLLFLRWSTAGIGYVVESAIRRGYQRNLEAQADRLALWYMSKAGYDPREGIRLLQGLQSRQGLSAFIWDTHRSYGARARALTEELVYYSARGLSYPLLRRTSADFARFQDKIPTSQIRVAQ